MPPGCAASRVRYYRSLSYAFGVRAPEGPVLSALDRILAGFRCRSNEPLDVPVYTVTEAAERGPRGGGERWQVSCGDVLLMDSNLETGVIDHLLWRVALATVKVTTDRLIVHAGSLVTPSGDALVLPAESGSGKTTLVLGLVADGFGLLSDEFAVLDLQDGLVHPYPRAVGLKSGSLRMFPHLRAADEAFRTDVPIWQGTAHVPVAELTGTGVPAPAQLRHVISTRYVPGATTTLMPLSRAHTLVALATNTLNGRAFAPDLIPALAALTAPTHGYSLVSGDLHEAVAAVRSACTGRSAAVAGLSRA